MLTGMLLELGAEEVASVLADDSVREEAVQHCLKLLVDAGDDRAV